MWKLWDADGEYKQQLIPLLAEDMPLPRDKYHAVPPLDTHVLVLTSGITSCLYNIGTVTGRRALSRFPVTLGLLLDVV